MCGAAKVRSVTRAAEGVVDPEGVEEGVDPEGVEEDVDPEGVEEDVDPEGVEEGVLDPEGGRSCGRQASRS